MTISGYEKASAFVITVSSSEKSQSVSASALILDKIQFSSPNSKT